MRSIPIHHPQYVCITSSSELPYFRPSSYFLAIILVEQPISEERRVEICKWLAELGCRYMVAWGLDSSLWDDTMDFVNMEQFDYGDIPEESMIFTVWMEDETIVNAFWYSKNIAVHPTLEIDETVIVHLSLENKEDQLINLYRRS